MDITTIAIILLFCFVFVIAFVVLFFAVEPFVRWIAEKIRSRLRK